ncbi:5-oxoprolinase subunit PxpA [Pseudidiomarina terrestris]|uniref:5-oxoprolinase subunit PxpA n=1 Tax=Pseudidiomarina terrestris TaxID=2820060 RepID=UPI00264ACF39|nr:MULTISPECIES: 5-oxoprolinase subunit PxpA [unclassified Pseudidiomarina]MDN7127150.1 5-oxoprolinase subunit PxpA [Pseudidiomarina sp. 1APR75-33.1]MDN7135437.1 5-oxoprolinase subunit PxpA [Pseudidiomarina sp. 1ASP75-5]MDN7138531.1 5-oxoprolinase subunit PxpA [Pseudidiomarina sp. 1ASP75-14]
MDLNCDLGEGYGVWRMGDDAAVMPFIDRANIACGFHAGDYAIMQNTVRLAKQHQVLIGAHPSYPDRHGFGRRAMSFSDDELQAMLLYQLGSLDAICRAEQVPLSYVKPHGALYNAMQVDSKLFEAVVCTLQAFNRGRAEPLALMTLAKIHRETETDIAAKYEVPLLFEAFADRRYEANGELRARNFEGAVLLDHESIVSQALAFATGQSIQSHDGTELWLAADTLCVHGDNPQALAAVKAIRENL